MSAGLPILAVAALVLAGPADEIVTAVFEGRSMDKKQSGAAPGFFDWVAKPFKEDMDVLNWVLFVIFLVTVAFLWTRVLNQISEYID